jgi:hypothetical protein
MSDYNVHGYHMSRERWAKLSFIDQLGNIGSEVSRAINAHRAGFTLGEERAIARSIDLFQCNHRSKYR